MIPHLVIYADSVPSHMAGKANGPIISIHTNYKGNTGVLMHELEHVKQWWAFVLISAVVAAWLLYVGEVYWFFAFLPGAAAHSLLYAMCAPYRLWSEVRAYRVQARHYTDDRTASFAYAISSAYGLDITQEEALKLLEKK